MGGWLSRLNLGAAISLLSSISAGALSQSLIGAMLGLRTSRGIATTSRETGLPDARVGTMVLCARDVTRRTNQQRNVSSKGPPLSIRPRRWFKTHKRRRT